jgi:hypothetical protein
MNERTFLAAVYVGLLGGFLSADAQGESKQPSEVVFSETFDGAGLKDGWTIAPSEAGRVSAGESGWRVAIPKGEQTTTRLYRKIDLPTDGRIRLEAEARWGGGNGCLNIFFVQDPTQSRLKYEGPRLEFVSDSQWADTHWWTLWGTPKNFLKIASPDQWSRAETSAGLRTTAGSSWYLVVSVDAGDALWRRRHVGGVDFVLRNITVKHLPTRPLEVALSQSVWLEDVLPLSFLVPKTTIEQTSDASDPAADLQQTARQVARTKDPIAVEAELRDADNDLVWEGRLDETGVNGALTLQIPRPAQASSRFRLTTRIAQKGKIWQDEWDLWTPARRTYAFEEAQPSAVPVSEETSRFELWADAAPDAAYDLASLIPPGWKYRSLAAHEMADTAWTAEERQRGWVRYFPPLERQILQDDVPLPTERPADGYRVAAAAGTQAFVLLGFHALRDMADVRLELDPSGVPDGFKNRITLRRMLFVPRKNSEGTWRWREGAFVLPWRSGLKKGETALFLIAVDIPPGATSGLLKLPLVFQEGSATPDHFEIGIDIYHIPLEEPTGKYAFFTGPMGSETWRGAAYRETAALGLDTVILYNHPTADLRFKDGKLAVDFERFEREMKLCRQAGLPIDGAPWVLNVMFLESWLTHLAQDIRANPRAPEIVGKKPMNRNIPPTNTAMEKRLFEEFLAAVKSSSGKKPWPKEIWIQTEDEAEYNYHAMDKVKRFGLLAREAGFRSLLTQMLTQGLDVAGALPEAVDERMPQYLSGEVAEAIRESGDGLNFYSVGQLPFRAYFLDKFQPKMIGNWAMYWPQSPGFYKPIDKDWSAGESFLWQGKDERPIPTLNALRLASEIQDARLLATARKVQTASPAGEEHKALSADLAMMRSQMPADSVALRKKIEKGELPFRNLENWRRILLDDIRRATQPAKEMVSGE